MELVGLIEMLPKYNQALLKRLVFTLRKVLSISTRLMNLTMPLMALSVLAGESARREE